jgi:hypothetical protein
MRRPLAHLPHRAPRLLAPERLQWPSHIGVGLGSARAGGANGVPQPCQVAAVPSRCSFLPGNRSPTSGSTACHISQGADDILDPLSPGNTHTPA